MCVNLCLLFYLEQDQIIIVKQVGTAIVDGITITLQASKLQLNLINVC